MSQALPNNLIHNPFHNRFNDPVTHRRDEMQAHENAVWLRERNGTQTLTDAIRWSTIVDNQTTSDSTVPWPSRIARVFAAAFALLLALLISVSMLKVF